MRSCSPSAAQLPEVEMTGALSGHRRFQAFQNFWIIARNSRSHSTFRPW